MTTPAKPSTLIAALVAAQAAARPVEKDARNNFHRYNYVSAEAMIADAKEILAAHGLALMPGAFNLIANPGITATVKTKDGAQEFGAAGILQASWALVHSSGERAEVSSHWPIVPEAGRPLDKAVAAARTASLSYLLRDLLQLPRVEEGTGLDDERRDHHHQDNRPPSKPQPSAKARPDTAGPTEVQATEIKSLLTKLGITVERGAYIDSIVANAESVDDFDRILSKLHERLKTKAADDAEMRGHP